MQNQYIATYSPGSFVFSVGQCTLYFDLPKVKQALGDGLYKLALDGSLSGPNCPMAGTSMCFQNYLVTASADGVLSFVDTAAEACPAFVTLAGSNVAEGKLMFASVLRGQYPEWAPAGHGGAYSAAAGTVTLSTPGCTGNYKADPASGMALALGTGPKAFPGTAKLAFESASPAPACPAECFEGGYFVVWDASGEPWARAWGRGLATGPC